MNLHVQGRALASVFYEYPSRFGSSVKFGEHSRGQIHAFLIWGPRSHPYGSRLPWLPGDMATSSKELLFPPAEVGFWDCGQKNLNLIQSRTIGTLGTCRVTASILHFAVFAVLVLHLPLCGVFSRIWTLCIRETGSSEQDSWFVSFKFSILGEADLCKVFFWFKSAPCWPQVLVWFKGGGGHNASCRYSLSI